MQHDLVENRRWVLNRDYAEGLAFSQLSPGPLAAQLAMYLGWVRGGSLGATATGVVFILPSFLVGLALAAIYVHLGPSRLDTGDFLWYRGSGYRHHRPKCFQARKNGAREGLVSVGTV